MISSILNPHNPSTCRAYICSKTRYGQNFRQGAQASSLSLPSSYNSTSKNPERIHFKSLAFPRQPLSLCIFYTYNNAFNCYYNCMLVPQHFPASQLSLKQPQ